ncbi:MAG: PhzF family phenazine biosynthesis protein [Candidatus Thorarchaeota archaeon]
MRHQHVIKVVQVDAFTDRPFGGNPAVVILDADNLRDSDIEAIAREIITGQTLFVRNSKVADFKFQYMTPTGEMSFSGHLTVAGFSALAYEGLIDIVQDVNMFTVETLAGVLEVEVVKNESSMLHEVQITHPTPQFMETYDPKDITKALGLSLADIMSPHPVQTVSTGTPQLMVPVSTLRALERIHPNWERLNELQRDSDWVSIQVFTRETLEPTSDVHVRHFAPFLGINEDPVTGSGAGSMGAYMIKYGMFDVTIPVTSIVIEQGHFMGRPGKIFVEVVGDSHGITQVKVSGTGVPVLHGTMTF